MKKGLVDNILAGHYINFTELPPAKWPGKDSKQLAGWANCTTASVGLHAG